jgi:hypothetical protein
MELAEEVEAHSRPTGRGNRKVEEGCRHHVTVAKPKTIETVEEMVASVLEKIERKCDDSFSQ